MILFGDVFGEKDLKMIEENEKHRRIENQIAQYASVEDMHSSLGSINEYWKKECQSMRFRDATKTKNHIDLYAKAISQGLSESNSNAIASLGSGDGAVEVEVAKEIEKLGFNEYEFHFFELSPIQNERAKKRIRDENLSGIFKTLESDLNNWVPTQKYAGIMAHHSLHHFLELENLFGKVKSALSVGGSFVSFDVIGRNGHMRWPETYDFVNMLFKMLPKNKRKHQVLQYISDEFQDHDCSTDGFEGIRAQDILKLLNQNFHFHTFFAWGGIIDVFTGRAYGGNFDAANEEDQRFISFVDELNEILIENGTIKPTQMCAIMKNEEVPQPLLYNSRTPQMMLREC